jgi:hypothetical protein
VKVSPAVLARQLALGTRLADALDRLAAAQRPTVGRDTTTAAATPGTTAAPGAGSTPPADRAALGELAGELADLYAIVEGSDAPPTPQTEAAIAERLRRVDILLGVRR